MDYAAAFLALFGTALLARKSWVGWPVFVACSGLWIAWGVTHGAGGIVVQNGVLLVFEVYGWWKWRER